MLLPYSGKKNFQTLCFLFTECNPGFTGVDCFLKCQYPLYGKNCQKICTCELLECDLTFGCAKGKCFYLNEYDSAEVLPTSEYCFNFSRYVILVCIRQITPQKINLHV